MEERDQSIRQLQKEIQALEGRDLQLLSIGLLVLVIVAGGFGALIFPNVMWDLGELRVAGRYLPQLFFGFVSLIVLFNIYAFQQRWVLRNTREELVRQLIRSEAAEQLAMVDSLTGAFNRRYLEAVLPKEVGRAERRESSLCLVMTDVDGFKSVNTRFGHVVGDRILVEVAQLLKDNLRVSDSIIRYGGDEFLVLMGDTDEREAQFVVDRIQERVDRWNDASLIPSYEMALTCGLALYTKGADINQVLEAAEQRMYQQKLRNSPVG